MNARRAAPHNRRRLAGWKGGVRGGVFARQTAGLQGMKRINDEPPGVHAPPYNGGMLRKIRPTTAAGARDITGRPLNEIPVPPAFLNAVGRAKFEEIARYLIDLGALTAGEVVLVEQFAAVYSRWVAAEEALAAGDPGWRTVVSRGGTPGSTVPTGPMAQSMRSLEQLRKLGAALGLAPVERLRLPAVRDGGEDDPMEALLAAQERFDAEARAARAG